EHSSQDPRRDRGPPDHRVRRSRRRPLPPERSATVDPQITTRDQAPSIRNDRDQRRDHHPPAHDPTRDQHPPGRTRTPQSKALKQMTQLRSYHDLSRAEQSSRTLHAALPTRTTPARTRDAIEAHLTIVFAALAIARYL